MSLWRKRGTSDTVATDVHHNEQKPDHLVNIVTNLSIQSDDLSIKREKAMREVQRLGQEIEQSKGIEMRQALEDLIEAVETAINAGDWKVDGACDPTLVLIRAKEALAQPEPVGKFAKFTDGIWREVTDGSAGVPLYTTPPQRKPLTDEEISEYAERMEASDPTDSFWREFARAIEAAHGIKE